MAKKKTRTHIVLTNDEKMYNAIQGLFILLARQIGMSGDEIRKILGGEKANINAVTKVINKAMKRKDKK